MSDFSAGNNNVTGGPTKASGDATTLHQLSGSVSISGTLCFTTDDNLSGALAGPGSYLGLGADGCLVVTESAGGGGGSGISWDGSTANGVATFKDSDEATVESKLTFDGAAELLSLTGAIIQTGSTATFFVADGQEDAFVISGSAGGYNPSLGLMNVDTSKQTVRFGGGVNIPRQWALNFGNLDGESNGEAKLTYGGVNLIISGAAGGETRVTGSTHFAQEVRMAEGLFLTGALNYTGSAVLSGTLTMTGPSALPLLVMDDSDASAQIGRTHIGYDGTNSDMAVFAHQDNANDTDFALRQRANGQTEVNAKGTNSISFKIASATKMQIGAAGDVGIGANHSPSYLLDVSGSTRLGTDVNSAHNVIATGSMYVGTPTSTTLAVDSPNGAITIAANTGMNSGVTISGGTSMTGSEQYNVLTVECASETFNNGRPTMVVNSNGVGLGVGSPSGSLDIAWNPGNLDNNCGSGETIFLGSGTTIAGKLYYMHTDGAWFAVTGSAVARGATQLLGIAKGTSPGDHGMFIRGFWDAEDSLSNFSTGKTVYVDTTAGGMDTTAPNSAGDFVRAVGYCINQSKIIYFNPDGAYTEVS